MPILTAKVGTNADLFPDVLTIYAREGDRILDMTYGRGVFWQQVDRTRYVVVTNDLTNDAKYHYDCRATQFPSSSFGVVVLDPPYMHGGATVKASINNCYLNANGSHRSVMELYYASIQESRRLLVLGGILIVKCQDETESGRQQLSHVEILNFVASDWRVLDLFVLVQATVPAMRVQYQKSARKNHSYFIVLRKTEIGVKQSKTGEENRMPRSPLTESVRKVQELLLKIKTTLTDDEFNLLLDELVPEPAPQSKSTKRTTKKPESKPRKGQCAACDYFKVDPVHHDSSRVGYHVYQSTKSARASGMASALNRSLAQQRQPLMLCTHVSEDGDDPTQCDEAEGNGIHDPSMGYRNYHPFVAPVATAAGRSSPKSSTDGSGVSSETPLGEDGVVVHGASGGG